MKVLYNTTKALKLGIIVRCERAGGIYSRWGVLYGYGSLILYRGKLSTSSRGRSPSSAAIILRLILTTVKYSTWIAFFLLLNVAAGLVGCKVTGRPCGSQYTMSWGQLSGQAARFAMVHKEPWKFPLSVLSYCVNESFGHFSSIFLSALLLIMNKRPGMFGGYWCAGWQRTFWLGTLPKKVSDGP